MSKFKPATHLAAESTTDAGPIAAPAPSTPRLATVRFLVPQLLSGVSSMTSIDLRDKHRDWQVHAMGARVLVRAPGEDVRDIPAAECILHWEFDGSLEDLARAIAGRRG